MTAHRPSILLASRFSIACEQQQSVVCLARRCCRTAQSSSCRLEKEEVVVWGFQVEASTTELRLSSSGRQVDKEAVALAADPGSELRGRAYQEEPNEAIYDEPDYDGRRIAVAAAIMATSWDTGSSNLASSRQRWSLVERRATLNWQTCK